MCPPLKQKLLCYGLKPWSYTQVLVLCVLCILCLVEQLPKFLSIHVAMAHDLVGVGSHRDVSLEEEDVVNLVLPPDGIRAGLVVDAGQVAKVLQGQLKRKCKCNVTKPLLQSKTLAQIINQSVI